MKENQKKAWTGVYMVVEASCVSLVLTLLELSELSVLPLAPILLRPVVSFSPFTTDFLQTVARKMRTP